MGWLCPKSKDVFFNAYFISNGRASILWAVLCSWLINAIVLLALLQNRFTYWRVKKKELFYLKKIAVLQMNFIGMLWSWDFFFFFPLSAVKGYVCWTELRLLFFWYNFQKYSFHPHTVIFPLYQSPQALCGSRKAGEGDTEVLKVEGICPSSPKRRTVRMEVQGLFIPLQAVFHLLFQIPIKTLHFCKIRPMGFCWVLPLLLL